VGHSDRLTPDATPTPGSMFWTFSISFELAGSAPIAHHPWRFSDTVEGRLISQKPASPDTFLDRLYAKINGGLDKLGTASPAQVAAFARRPRKSWSFELMGVQHTVELKRKMWRWESGARLFCDGHRMGNLQKPGGKHGRTEDALILGNTPVVVALEWRRDWAENLQVEIFVDDISLIDGRTLEQARAAAPGVIGQYDSRMWRVQRALSQNLMLVLILPASMAVGGGCVGGILVGLLIGLWELGWMGGAVLVNRHNLARPDLGAVRWAVLLGYVVAYPILSYLVLVAAYTTAHPH